MQSIIDDTILKQFQQSIIEERQLFNTLKNKTVQIDNYLEQLGLSMLNTYNEKKITEQRNVDQIILDETTLKFQNEKKIMEQKMLELQDEKKIMEQKILEQQTIIENMKISDKLTTEIQEKDELIRKFLKVFEVDQDKISKLVAENESLKIEITKLNSSETSRCTKVALLPANVASEFKLKCEAKIGDLIKENHILKTKLGII